MSTQGVKFLEQNKVPFELVRYDHQVKGAIFAAKSTGFPLSRTIKTLVVDLGSRTYSLALLSGDRQLNLKQLSRVLGAKRAAMVDTATAERITGYKIGGISPFGVRQPMQVVMDESLIEYESVMINAGQRGLMLRMSPLDIRDALDSIIASISAEG